MFNKFRGNKRISFTIGPNYKWERFNITASGRLSLHLKMLLMAGHGFDQGVWECPVGSYLLLSMLGDDDPDR